MKEIVNGHFKKAFGGIYHGRKVLVTGHTGFKGSWLCAWLKKLGAEVIGYALPPPTNPNHFSLLKLDITSVLKDIRIFKEVTQTINEHKPEIIFHLAAQPLVLESYKNPRYTFETNILGSINIYEAAKSCETVKALLTITTDKVYLNREWPWPYRETDEIGGNDPYSASKACVEMIVAAYSNLNLMTATARAGNIIGGGDWSPDRILPDIIRSLVNNHVLEVRYPNAIRPWQYVLDPLAGYLILGQKLLEKDSVARGTWNFGPSTTEMRSVMEILEAVQFIWKPIPFKIKETQDSQEQAKEAQTLTLDSSKAISTLGWRPLYSIHKSIEKSINWYKAFYQHEQVPTARDLECYMAQAQEQGCPWIN